MLRSGIFGKRTQFFLSMRQQFFLNFDASANGKNTKTLDRTTGHWLLQMSELRRLRRRPLGLVKPIHQPNNDEWIPRTPFAVIIRFDRSADSWAWRKGDILLGLGEIPGGNEGPD